MCRSRCRNEGAGRVCVRIISFISFISRIDGPGKILQSVGQECRNVHHNANGFEELWK